MYVEVTGVTPSAVRTEDEDGDAPGQDAEGAVEERYAPPREHHTQFVRRAAALPRHPAQGSDLASIIGEDESGNLGRGGGVGEAVAAGH